MAEYRRGAGSSLSYVRHYLQTLIGPKEGETRMQRWESFAGEYSSPYSSKVEPPAHNRSILVRVHVWVPIIGRVVERFMTLALNPRERKFREFESHLFLQYEPR